MYTDPRRTGRAQWFSLRPGEGYWFGTILHESRNNAILPLALGASVALTVALGPADRSLWFVAAIGTLLPLGKIVGWLVIVSSSRRAIDGDRIDVHRLFRLQRRMTALDLATLLGTLTLYGPLLIVAMDYGLPGLPLVATILLTTLASFSFSTRTWPLSLVMGIPEAAAQRDMTEPAWLPTIPGQQKGTDRGPWRELRPSEGHRIQQALDHSIWRGAAPLVIGAALVLVPPFLPIDLPTTAAVATLSGLIVLYRATGWLIIVARAGHLVDDGFVDGRGTVRLKVATMIVMKTADIAAVVCLVVTLVVALTSGFDVFLLAAALPVAAVLVLGPRQWPISLIMDMPVPPRGMR